MEKALLDWYLKRMGELAVPGGDIQGKHSDADDLLAEFVRKLGYGELVGLWDKVPKWYA